MKITKSNLISQCLFILVVGSMFNSAQATVVSRAFSGNDCSGYFSDGSGFDSCTIFVNSSGQQIELSPVIIKFDENLNVSEINDTHYPAIDGTEFEFSNLSGNNGEGTWTYTPDDLVPDGDPFDPLAHDPGIKYWVAKAGNGFELFWDVDESATLAGGTCDVADIYVLDCLEEAQTVSSGDWITPLKNNGNPRALSHLTLYNTVPPSLVNNTGQAPEPGILLLYASAFIGFTSRKSLKRK